MKHPRLPTQFPLSQKKLHAVKEKLYGVQYQSVTQRTYLPFVGVCKRKVGIEKKRNIAQAVPESESCVWNGTVASVLFRMVTYSPIPYV